MPKIIVTFNSITYALKGRKILARADIVSKLVKVDSNLTNGCTYGVEIDDRHYFDAIGALKNASINYSIYNP